MKKEAERDVVKPKICKLEASEDADVKKYYKGVTNTKNDTIIEKEPDTKNENDIKKETNIEKEPDSKKQTNAKMKMKPTRLGPRSRLTSSNNATVSFFLNSIHTSNLFFKISRDSLFSFSPFSFSLVISFCCRTHLRDSSKN